MKYLIDYFTEGRLYILRRIIEGGCSLYMDIPIEKIVTKDNVRKDFDKDAIRGLAKSIVNVGLLQPVIVRENNDGTYTLLVGHRRFEAARLAEVKSIRAIIFDDSESKLMLQLIENPTKTPSDV